MEKWSIKFVINSYTSFDERIMVNNIEFFRESGLNYAQFEVEANYLEDAEKHASDNLKKVMIAMGFTLGQVFRAAIIDTVQIDNQSQGTGMSYLTSRLIVTHKFPKEKISDIEGILRLASNDDKVNRILELSNLIEANSWVNLYRIVEIISNDIDVVSKGWVSKNKIELFRRTACSPDVIGIEARHGISVGQPPKNPMSHEEATYLMKDLRQKWIDAKRAIFENC